MSELPKIQNLSVIPMWISVKVPKKFLNEPFYLNF